MSSLVPIVFEEGKIHVHYKGHFQKQIKGGNITLFASTNSDVVLRVGISLQNVVTGEV